MIKREAKFQTEFAVWFKKYGKKHFKTTALFELKQTKGPMPFSRVEEHQIAWLMSVGDRPQMYKIPDDTRSYRPADCIGFIDCHGYVVIKYGKYFYVIHINDFVNEMKRSKRRSLTEERAEEISTIKATI